MNTPNEDARAAQNLRRSIVSGFVWKGSSSILIQATRFGLAIVLARLLTPREYGLAGMVLVFATFVIPFADLGLGAALVQRPVLTALDASTVFWASLGAGVVFTGAGVGISDLIARFYGEPDVRPLFGALSLSFVITSLSATQRSLLSREMQFRSLELRLMIATVAGAGVAIWAATMDYGAWALIALELTSASVSTLLLWVLSPWRPALAFSWDSLRELGRFGVNSLGARLMADLSAISDKLLIGRFLGAASLGAYTLSFNTVLSPFTRFVGPLQEVLFPAFSRIQDDPARIAAAWLRASRVIAAVAFPSLLGLVVVAPDFVPVVLGEKWHQAIPVMQLLAWAGLLQTLQGLAPSVLQARNRPGTLFRFTIASLAGLVAAIAIGLQWGLNGVAVAYAVLNTILAPILVWLTARSLGTSSRTFLRSITGVAVAAGAMAACVAIVRRALLETNVPASARLAVLVAVGCAVYLPLLAWRTREVVADIRSLRRSGAPSIGANANAL